LVFTSHPLQQNRLVVASTLSTPGGSVLGAHLDVKGKEVLARDFRPRDWIEQDGALFLEEREILAGWSKIRTRWIVVRNGKQEEFMLTLRLYSGAELAALLREVGFAKVEIFGSLEGIPYDQEAKRLVALATKP
jgi:hypothetical protein